MADRAKSIEGGSATFHSLPLSPEKILGIEDEQEELLEQETKGNLLLPPGTVLSRFPNPHHLLRSRGLELSYEHHAGEAGSQRFRGCELRLTGSQGADMPSKKGSEDEADADALLI